ncbi:hypothetical protein MUK70_03120 [Dyadobacter chenwenxiniae]|uniref:3-oxoacyl-ACP synthase n=1 Tax=Dyadobacter chenwenxiniae TaxID=2906456 RepID=A0A9X1PIY5_9BACT|nr:hypothetical protein [Dyadobacter chenwenxiniae]MCF0048904.1 hypothetical protein [Dyadobacter chenwenxiniae]MCF0062257.1 hypothetical protein [Dyadobacter chenwenxiniae]UON83987.1 hypothetical protein MUK70_03120 [Dyadobacter chenwenxiniae]
MNGEIVSTRHMSSADSWFKQIYKEQEFVYPKFYKMDALSQAGFLASELIKRSNQGLTSEYKDDEIAMLFANQSSSADTDMRFMHSYEHNGAPSPSLFVYTLPNIVLGEIAIRNKWYGENMFAVLPKFAPGFFVDYGKILLSTGAKALLCGWLGVLGDDIEVFVFLVESESDNGSDFNVENLTDLAQLGHP